MHTLTKLSKEEEGRAIIGKSPKSVKIKLVP